VIELAKFNERLKPKLKNQQLASASRGADKSG